MEISHYPLSDADTLDELDSYLFPDINWFDFSVIPKQIKAHHNSGDYAIMMGNGNIFKSAWYMRGFETLLADLIVGRNDKTVSQTAKQGDT